MKLLKRMLKKETGQALPMALIMLVLGGLLVVPMLSFMTTSLNANRTVDIKTMAIYAADAGIEDALWKLGQGEELFKDADSYPLKDKDGNDIILNGMTVTIDKIALEDTLYTIQSTAYLNGEEKAHIIAQAVSGSDYSWLFEHALISPGTITTSPHDLIYGGVLCGDFQGDEDQVQTGEIIETPDITLPSAEDLSDFYLSRFDDTVRADPNNYWPDPDKKVYPSGTYSIPSGTDEDNPHMIPWLYREGDLSLTGNGYGKLNGNIYLTGKLYLAPGTTLDLNGYTIFSKFASDPECEGDAAINFQPGCYLYGPGCIIGVGKINYQPNLGLGDHLVGADDVDTGPDTTYQDRFALYKFKATENGDLTSFQVKCYIDPEDETEAHVKTAIYDDDGASGAPKTLLGAVDYADNMTVISSWNPINFPKVEVTNKQYYWLAAISDYPVISKKTVSSTSLSRYKSQTFEAFTFPSDISTLTFDATSHTEQYMLRGFSHSQEFIMLMSVECSVNLQPHDSFYGCIVGDTNINLQPWCTINLVQVPTEPLEFPGITGSIGSGEEGNAPPKVSYTIQ